MFKRIKDYILKRKQHKWLIKGMLYTFNDTIVEAYRLMNTRQMDLPSIQSYIRHLPIIGIEEGYPKEVYAKATKCIVAMWKYAIDKRLISQDTSFMDFMGNDIGFRKLYKGNELKYRLSDGRTVDWKEYLEPLMKLVESIQKEQGLTL